MKNPFTRAGYARLRDEMDTLLRVERPKVVKGVADAAAEGDRSENAEYIYGKKRLREIDKRLSYLSALLKDAQIIDPSTLRGDKVCFGATVVIEEPDGTIRRLTLVGDGESDLKGNSISHKSPMARALMNHRVGDVVEIHRPKGEIEVEILEIIFGDE